MKKILLLILFISVILGLYFFTPVRDYLSKDGFVTLEAWIRAQGILAPVIFGLLYIAATVFALPGSALTIGGGLLFGTLWGTVINLTSATIGAMLAFLIARYLGRNAVTKLLRNQPKLAGLDERIGTSGFYSVLFLRLVPLFPFNALNYGLGLTKVTCKDYFLATAIGMLPGSFVYTSLGAASRHVDFKGLNTWADYHVWEPFVLVILLSLIPKMIQKRKDGNGR
jgi:uncharacterized membrane protein YdjX (TVP38/TMEM64 family)